MSMNRRELVTIGGMLGGAALLTATAKGQPPGSDPARPAEAHGKVILYGEGSVTYFALSSMPEGVETFSIDTDVHDSARLGGLILVAAEKGWAIRVRYPHTKDGGAGRVFDVRVEDFQLG